MRGAGIFGCCVFFFSSWAILILYLKKSISGSFGGVFKNQIRTTWLIVRSVRAGGLGAGLGLLDGALLKAHRLAPEPVARELEEGLVEIAPDSDEGAGHVAIIVVGLDVTELARRPATGRVAL